MPPKISRALPLLLALTLGCPSDDTEDDGADDGADSESGSDCADAPAFAEVAIFDKCTMCHSSTLTGAARNGAAVDVNFDTHPAAMASANAAVSAVNNGFMPPAGSGITVTQAEIDALELWAMCGTPQ